MISEVFVPQFYSTWQLVDRLADSLAVNFAESRHAILVSVSAVVRIDDVKDIQTNFIPCSTFLHLLRSHLRTIDLHLFQAYR